MTTNERILRAQLGDLSRQLNQAWMAIRFLSGGDEPRTAGSHRPRPCIGRRHGVATGQGQRLRFARGWRGRGREAAGGQGMREESIVICAGCRTAITGVERAYVDGRPYHPSCASTMLRSRHKLAARIAALEALSAEMLIVLARAENWADAMFGETWGPMWAEEAKVVIAKAEEALGI